MNQKTIRVLEAVYKDRLQHIDNLEKELDRKDTYILSLEEKLKAKDIVYKEMKQNYTRMANEQQRITNVMFDLVEENKGLKKQIVKLKERVYQELTPEREKVLLKEIKNIQRSNNKKNRLIAGYKYLLESNFKAYLDNLEIDTLKENEYEN